MRGAAERGGVWRYIGQIGYQTFHQDFFPVGGLVSDAAGAPTHYVASYIDITKRKQDESNIQYLAHYGPPHEAQFEAEPG